MADLPPNVTLAQLSYFVAVAEELNFTRAAERLHVSQSPLSQAIKALEANLGVVLLERTSRHVELTAAGEELLPAARAAIGAVEHAVNVARAAGQGEQRLRVGFLAFGACDVIDRSLAAFAAPVSDLRLETRQAEFSDPTAGLAAGNVDAAFLRLPVTSPGLELAPLTSEPRVAVLPAWHPLAGRESIAIGDLLDEHWLQMPGRDPLWRDFWLATAHRDGVTPLLGPEVRTIEEQLTATITGGYVSLTPASVAASYPRPGLSYVPVAGIEPSAVAIGWRRGDQRESVRRFVTSARALAPITRPEDRAQAQRSD
jgi:DNA-binding transcriptional LysR family regulator